MQVSQQDAVIDTWSGISSNGTSSSGYNPPTARAVGFGFVFLYIDHPVLPKLIGSLIKK